MQLDLTDEEALALLKLLTEKIESDRDPLSPHQGSPRYPRQAARSAARRTCRQTDHAGRAGAKSGSAHASSSALGDREPSTGHKRDTTAVSTF